MAFPPISLIIEAAFGYAPLGARVWTDITDAVRSLKCSRGKNQWLASAQPGSATFKLNNRDRRFDPSNTTGPFNPNLKVRVPIRVRAVYNAVTYPVWMGFAHKVHPEWPDGVNSDTIIEAAGILDFISGITALPPSVWDLVVRQTPNKRSWWRLGEKAGATLLIDQIGGFHGTYSGTETLGQAGLVAGDSDTAVKFNGVAGAKINDNLAALTAGDFTVLVVFSHAARSGTNREFLATQGARYNNVPHWNVWFSNSDGMINWAVDTGGGEASSWNSAGPVDDGLPHMIVGVRSGLTSKRSLDGAALLGTIVLGAAALPAGEMWIGDLLGNDNAFFPYNDVIDEVITFDRALTNTEISALYAALSAPWANDPTGTRISRILDYIGITAADRNIDTGNSTLQSELTLSDAAFSKLEDYRHAENGELFEGADGKINFHSRQHRMVTPFNVSQATFSNLNTATNPIKSGGVSAPLDDHQDFFNDVPVSRKNGVGYRATDPASQVDAGISTLTGYTDLPIASDLEVVDAANFLLNRYKTPRQRVDELHIDPFAKPDNLFPQVLGREIGDRITVAHQPAGGGPSFTTDQVIEGVDHEISVEGGLKWETVFRTNFAETALYLVFDDAVSGMFDVGVMAY